jgi:hypothetical protein
MTMTGKNTHRTGKETKIKMRWLLNSVIIFWADRKCYPG